MLLQAIRPLRIFSKAFLSADSPKVLAWSVAAGMLVGMVPKGNLTAVLLVMLFFSFRVNVGIGLLSVVIFSWVGRVCDPISHNLGNWLLTRETLEPMWTWMINQPVIPWTAFNNTVVLGSLFLACYLVAPVYLASLLLFEGCQPWLLKKLERFKISKFLTTAEVATRVGLE